MKILDRRKLLRTGPVDHADWNYRPILGNIQRLRFSLALDLLPASSNRMLEIGYGSGVFMPALKERTKELYGSDIHDSHAEVEKILATEGVTAKLCKARAEDLPFQTGFFDTVVVISALEFVDDLKQVCSEVRRVLAPDGCFVVVTPGRSPILDLGLRLLTGKSADQDFGNKRESIITTLSENFDIQRKRAFPPANGGLLTLYRAMRLSNKRLSSGRPQSDLAQACS